MDLKCDQLQPYYLISIDMNKYLNLSFERVEYKPKYC